MIKLLILILSVAVAQAQFGQGFFRAATNTASAGTDLNTSIVAYYKQDEASGIAIDEVGSNDLTDNATVTSNTGKVGTARQYTAANLELPLMVFVKVFPRLQSITRTATASAAWTIAPENV